MLTVVPSGLWEKVSLPLLVFSACLKFTALALKFSSDHLFPQNQKGRKILSYLTSKLWAVFY